jgi:hypothetical protein
MPPETMWFNDLTLGRFYCDWRRPPAGFRLEDSAVRLGNLVDGSSIEPVRGPWLVANSDPTRQFAFRYGPLGEPDLFRQFALLESEQDILRFASRYGFLTGGEFVTLGRAERIRDWYGHIREMRFLVNAWDWVKGEDRHSLEPFIWWQDEPRTVFRRFVFEGNDLAPRVALRQRSRFRAIEQGRADVAESQQFSPAPHLVVNDHVTDPSVLGPWRYGDVLDPAFDFVCMRVNRHLKGHIAPRVLPRRNGMLYLEVDCLLSALWLQLQFEISGIPTQTKQCGAPECTARIPLSRRLCDQCRVERRNATRRKTWHKNKEIYRGEGTRRSVSPSN